MTDVYDLIVIGAGSGGLTAAGGAAKFGAKVALVEKQRIGGDCTWTGCIPSKALMHIAKVAHQARQGASLGIEVESLTTNMPLVRDALRQAIDEVYAHETPEILRAEGIDVFFGGATFIDDHTIEAGGQTLKGRKFIICTGAHPFIPAIPGLEYLPYQTYETIFENDRLPAHLMVIGAGAGGAELAQAYRRLGAAVTLIDSDVLPQEDPEVSDAILEVFKQEGIDFIPGYVDKASGGRKRVTLSVNGQEVSGDMLLIASGRKPNVEGIGLEAAGVRYNTAGIAVNTKMQTNVRHIYAAGDCNGSPQFTNVAGYQAYIAARNALLPGSQPVPLNALTYALFTSPAVAQVGMKEVDARRQYGKKIQVTRISLDRIDRAVTDRDQVGFIKLIHNRNKMYGATIVSERADEIASELSLAISNNLGFEAIATAAHTYPTYSFAMQQTASTLYVDGLLAGPFGQIIRRLSSR